MKKITLTLTIFLCLSIPLVLAEDFHPQVKSPTPPSDPSASNFIKEPVPPKYPDETNGEKGKNVPLWVINQNKPAPYQAVGSGTSPNEASSQAIKKLKTEIRKYIIRSVAEKQELKNFDIEIQKRLLWQTAAATATEMEKFITIKNKWKSVDSNTFYVQTVYKDSSQATATEKNFKNEIDMLEKLGGKEYMKIEPIKPD